MVYNFVKILEMSLNDGVINIYVANICRLVSMIIPILINVMKEARWKKDSIFRISIQLDGKYLISCSLETRGTIISG